jgi:transposase
LWTPDLGRKYVQEVSMSRRKRRVFSEEQRAAAVEHVRSTGKTVAQAARDLDLTETALRRWVEEAERQASASPGEELSKEEREELGRLRRENQRLRMERDFLKKAAAFFAKEDSEHSS